MKILVAWSGDKDSQAALIWAVERFGSKNLIAVFCDTGWEHAVTYSHVKAIPKKLGVELVILKSKQFAGMVDMAIKKKRFPSTTRRFCTSELKTKPMIDYVLGLNDNCIIIQGIRAEESKSRSLMRQQCRYFRYYFEPYGYDKKGKPKLHTYRKKEVIEFCKKYADDVIRPHFDQDGTFIMNYIIDHNQSPNPLYFQGAKRVGCYPCIMCTKGEIKSILDNSPDHIEKIRQAEKDIGRTFFPPDFIPKRYCSGIDEKGNKFPYIDDVVRYINDKHATGDLFAISEAEEKKDRRCMSFYGICE